MKQTFYIQLKVVCGGDVADHLEVSTAHFKDAICKFEYVANCYCSSPLFPDRVITCPLLRELLSIKTKDIHCIFSSSNNFGVFWPLRDRGTRFSLT